MNTGKVRIYELSKELNLDNKAILAICEQLNISVKSHSSTISDAEAEQIRAAAQQYTAKHSSKSNPVFQRPKPSKKQQIVAIRSTRSSIEASQKPSQRLPLHRTPRIAQGYIEPLLEVGNALPLHMVLIPGGSFLMGSPTHEPDRSTAEDPQHLVSIDPFFMGRYPITQAQWRFVAGLPEVDHKFNPDPSYFKDHNRPVEQVSWKDAIEFCARLKTHTQRPYRLPTEAEWEYACRAHTTTPFYFGNTLTNELGNYGNEFAYKQPNGPYRGKTTPADYFGIANAFGLSDMHSNMWEWCEDQWHENYKEAPIDGSAWVDQAANSDRVLRGGSWGDDLGDCRAATRGSASPTNRDNQVGFRLVCSAPRTL
jgi:formylglycine-generating enzyme required for sulfatase activity